MKTGTVIVSIQRDDVVFIDYMKADTLISEEYNRIVKLRGNPIREKKLSSGAMSLKYYGEFGYETVMICSS